MKSNIDKAKEIVSTYESLEECPRIIVIECINTKLIKICYTKLPSKFILRSMQSGSSTKLRTYKVWENAEYIRQHKRLILLKLKKYQHHGEWYDFSKDKFDFVDFITKTLNKFLS